MSSALEHQEGGNHYKKWPIQPIQFSMENHYDPCAHDILKYVVRHKDKDGLLDLQKSIHYVDLRRELIKSKDKDWPWRVHITMDTFLRTNGITDPLMSKCLHKLDYCVRYSAMQIIAYDDLKEAIRSMIDELQGFSRKDTAS